MEDNKKKIQLDKWDICFIVVLFLSVVVLVSVFAFKKEGWHSDEVWEYGFANSYYEPYIYSDVDGNPVHFNEWDTSKTLKDYVVVNKGEEFSYDSVFYNQKKDLSPPLHAMLLHTVCSFFPDTFSFWYAFIINVCFFVITLVFLYKLFILIKDKPFALLLCAFYGVSAGAIDMFMYSRMYGMTAGLLVCFLYVLVKGLQSEGDTFRFRTLLALILIAFSGFLTHYYFIAVIGLFTFFFCAYLFFEKKIKKMLQLGCSMLFGLALAIGIYPGLLKMFSTQTQKIENVTNVENRNYNFVMRFKIMLNFILRKQFKVEISLYGSSVIPIIIGVLVFALIVMFPLFVLLRDTPFVKKIIEKICYACKNYKQVIKDVVQNINWVCVVFFIVTILQLIVVAQTANIAGMGAYSDRYIAYLYPIGTGVILLAEYTVISWIFARWKRKGKKIHIAVFLVLVFINIFVNEYNVAKGSPYYFVRNVDKASVAELVEDGNVIYLEKGLWFLTAMVPVLMESHEYFHTVPDEYSKYKEAYLSRIDKPMFLVINMNTYELADLQFATGVSEDNFNFEGERRDVDKEFEDLLAYFEALVPETSMEYVGGEIVYGRTIQVYRINP